MITVPAMVGPEEVFQAFSVSRESQVRLRLYAALLQQWQEKINLVGRETLPFLWHRHIADGLQLTRFMGSTPRVLIDMGSGAGIPGMIVALAYPHHQVTLIESNRKKVAFLMEVARRCRISVKILAERIERVDSAPYRMTHPIVTARALAPLSSLLDLTAPFLEQGTGLFYKGQDVGSELTDSQKSWRIRYIAHQSVIEPKSSILEVLEAQKFHEQTNKRGRQGPADSCHR